MGVEMSFSDDHQIRSKIYTIRGVQVILDRDIAALYNVETRRLNEQVKRNKKRFPESFMFQLTKDELDDWMSQIAISNKEKMGIRKMPYAFTEQGVAMLSAVLNSSTAIKMSIQIMNAFVYMRRFFDVNVQLFQHLDQVRQDQIAYRRETDEKFDQIFKALESGDYFPKQGIFYEGQVFDAYCFVTKLIRKAKKSIIVIDNYVDESVLTLLSKKSKLVRASIYTKNISKQLKLDLKKYNAQYSNINVDVLSVSHDRFLILDGREIYHIGASLKDLGKKWFAFSLLDKQSLSMLDRLPGVARTF